MCVAAATEACAQDPSSIVLNQTLNGFEVFADTPLNVVNQSGQVTATTSAIGNDARFGVDGVQATVTTNQAVAPGSRVGAASIMDLNGDTAGRVTAVVQARGNYLEGAAYDGGLAVDAVQTVDGDHVRADALIPDDDARLLAGATVAASAIGNAAALGGQGSGFTGRLDQSVSATVEATNFAGTQYIPAPADFSAEALANVVTVTSGPNAAQGSFQNLDIRQRATGDRVYSDASGNAGNGWNLAARANSSANRIVLANQGGSVVAVTDQANSARVRAGATVTAYDYGAAHVSARAAANELAASNNDIWLELDATQINTGGVEAQAQFSGHNGYDAYVGADAVGNSVTGSVCADCGGQLTATVNQTNAANVSAVANTAVTGSGRAVITGANAVGNSATFYVTRPQ